MSITLIAMMGILLGFLCLMIGFFMEGTEAEPLTASIKEKRAPKGRKKSVVKVRKAA